MPTDALYLEGASGKIELEIRQLLAEKSLTINRRDKQIIKLRIRELCDDLLKSNTRPATEAPTQESSEALFDGEVGIIESQLRLSIHTRDNCESSAGKASFQREIDALVEILKSSLLQEDPNCYANAKRAWGIVRSQNLGILRDMEGLLIRALRDPVSGHSLVHRASLIANVDLVNLLVTEKGCDVNCMCYSGQTPLHLAVGVENFRVARRLVELGADPQIEDFSGKDPFFNVSRLVQDNILSSKSPPDFGVKENMFEIDAADLITDHPIDAGATATVFSGTCKSSPVAVKEFEKSSRQSFLREVGILSRLKHPNIAAFIGACASKLQIALELCLEGSLYDLLHVEKASLSVAKILQICTDTVQALEYLHFHCGIVHLDVKSKNLLFSGPHIKLIDFGSARSVKNLVSEPIVTGTWWWMSPEALFGDDAQIGPKSDIYSFGICLFEILCRQLPSENTELNLAPVTIAIKVSSGWRPTGSICGDAKELGQLETLMKQCWADLPVERPDSRDVLNTLAAIQNS